MSARGFSINTRAIAQMTAEIQREFDRHPIHVPVEAAAGVPSASTVYNGPVVVVNGDSAQIAWGNRDVALTNRGTVATGFEPLAQAIASTLAGLDRAPLGDADREVARTVADEALEEISKPQPNASVVRRAVSALKGVLVSLVLDAGSSAASAAATEWATTAIQQLTGAVPQ